jgi:hypothetical protein
MFKSKLTLALATVGFAGLAATQSANATSATTSPGPSELLLAVVDTTTGSTYYRDLGVSTSGGTTAPNIASFSQTLNDSNWTAFLSASGSDPLVYAVVGGAHPSLPSASNPNNFVTTTGSNPAGSITRSNVNNWAQIDTFILQPLNLSNASDTSTANNNTYFANAADGNNTLPLFLAQSMQNWKGFGPTNTQSVGQNSFFYDVIAANGFGTATTSLLGTFNLTGNTLTYTAAGGPTVPLPAAVWLLGSGLLGLAGVGRRRQSA